MNMKKLISKVVALVLFSGMLTACGEQDNVQLDVDSAQSVVGFNTLSSNLPAWAPELPQYTLEVIVGATNRVNYDREVVIDINEELTDALPAEYTIDQSSLVIPAGDFVAKIKIRAFYNEIPPLVKHKLVFDLVSVEGQDILLTDKNRHVVSLFRACPIERDNFTGTYEAIEDGDTANSYYVESTPGTAANELLLSNVWNVDPESVTHVFLGSDVANPNIIWPVDYLDNLLVNSLPPYESYGKLYIAGTGGSFDSCTGNMVLKFSARFVTGSFAPTVLVLNKL